jgi:hypothetical protein
MGEELVTIVLFLVEGFVAINGEAERVVEA